MRLTHVAVFLLIAVALIVNANADHVSLSVDTNSSHWSIYRQSNNISFNSSSLVEGKISPVEFHGRILKPYQSYYEEVGSNDVRLKQRTSALEGSYKSSDEIKLQSFVDLGAVEITIDKPAGTNIYTIEYKNENWPVFLRASRTLAYSGLQINNREFEGNNGDFVGSNFLYNRELSKEQRSVIWLRRANATVLATDEAILSAEFKPTKYLGYLIRSNSTGIADLSYRQRDFKYDVKHQTYHAVNEGEERYYGAYNLARKVEMRSVFEKFNDTEEDAESWLSCCYDGWENMEYSYQKDFGLDVKGVFDCTCFNGTMKA
jgi:hypothetical protein